MLAILFANLISAFINRWLAYRMDLSGRLLMAGFHRGLMITACFAALMIGIALLVTPE